MKLPRGAQNNEKPSAARAAHSHAERTALARQVGSHVKAHRKRLDITISDLARAADVSISRLSKLERGDILPSLSCLLRIASALNRPLAAFIPVSQVDAACWHVKAGEGVRIEKQGAQSGYQSCQLGFCVSDSLVVEASLVGVDETARARLARQEEALRLIHILSGKLSYRCGNQTYVLETGDTLLFDAMSSHGLEQLTEAPTRFLSIAVYHRDFQ
jgi:transcriptional regulator with XRE-family HTH domain